MFLSRASLLAAAFAAVAGTALAQGGVTTGPSAGTNVEPSTATQKRGMNPDPSAAGAPGVEGLPGAESGRSAAEPKTEPNTGPMVGPGEKGYEKKGYGKE